MKLSRQALFGIADILSARPKFKKMQKETDKVVSDIGKELYTSVESAIDELVTQNAPRDFNLQNTVHDKEQFKTILLIALSRELETQLHKRTSRHLEEMGKILGKKLEESKLFK